jgi:uncharacterized protein YecE (DUF72 family)
MTAARTSPSHAHPNRIRLGIGSWTDKEYRGVLYPKGLPDNQRLTTYATKFNFVELNSSYHRLPPIAFVENWVRQTPADFVFDFKLPREFSGNPDAAARDAAMVNALLRTAEPLLAAKKLGAFFLVLPPSFGPEKHRLRELDLLVGKLRPHRLAVELRDRRWIEEPRRAETLDYFRANELVFIGVDMPRIEGSNIMPPVDEVTNPKLAYLRLHGRRPDWLELKDAEAKHSYAYSEAELDEIAVRVRALAAKAETVHVVANNHAQDFAPRTALALQERLGIQPANGGSPESDQLELLG